MEIGPIRPIYEGENLPHRRPDTHRKKNEDEPDKHNHDSDPSIHPQVTSHPEVSESLDKPNEDNLGNNIDIKI